MFRWYEKLLCRLLLASGRYRIVRNDDAFLEASLSLLDQAYSEKAFGTAVSLGGDLFSLIDTKTNEVVGCAHTYFADDLWQNEAQRKLYFLDLFSKHARHEMVITDILILQEGVKNKRFTRLMLNHIYSYYCSVRKINFHLCYTRPGIVKFYRACHHIPIADNYDPRYGLYRIMVFYDGEKKLSKQKSFLEKFNPRFSYPELSKFINFENLLLHDVSKKSLKKIYKDAIMVTFHHNDVIMAEGSNAQYMGIIYTGRVNVIKRNTLVGQLSQGEFIGELSVILQGGRTASVIADGHDTRVIFLAKNAIDRAKNRKDQNRILENIIVVLSNRLVVTTGQASL